VSLISVGERHHAVEHPVACARSPMAMMQGGFRLI
jgi:hypothetical protein